VFNGAIDLAKPREGDVLGILCAGGYGTSMSSNYNLREYAPEVLVDGEKITLTRRRQTFEEIIQTYV
jgi:diaminopimelate decarboxylase